MQIKFILSIFITLIFFASSSLLTKLALVNSYIDAYSFTFFRLFFASLTLIILVFLKEKRVNFSFKENYLSSLMLFSYAIFFSYAYLSLDAGLGALILFAFVQITIIIYFFIKKEKVSFQKFFGLFVSFTGLVYLLYPSQEFELSFFHVFLMTLAGISWGIYTLLGKNSFNASLHTMDNFIKATFLAMIFFIVFYPNLVISLEGLILAFVSGGITSALAYSLWYYLLPKIQTLTAGILQLLVPPLAIFLSVIFLDENLNYKLFFSTVVILLGIVIALVNKK